MGIIEFAETFETVDIDKIIEQSFFDNEAEIIDILQENQLLKGLDQFGARIGEYSQPEYAKMKFQMNNQAGLGFIDLRLDGDFYKGMALEKIDKDFQIRSSDSKAEKLTKQFGEEIYGLSEDSAGLVAQDYILESLTNGIREVLNV